MAERKNKKRDGSNFGKESFVSVTPYSKINYAITSNEWRTEFIHKMLSWANQPGSVFFKQFLMQEKIFTKQYYEWVEKYPDLAEAHEEIKLMLTTNRVVGALNRKFDPMTAHRGLGVLDPEQHAINVYEQEFKEKRDSQGNIFNINIIKPSVGTPEELKRCVDDTL